MAASSVDVDTLIPEQTEGAVPPVATAGMGSLDSFQHVDAVMKEDDVSTVGFDSQDWEMVSDMVADTENAATDFMQGKHVPLVEPKMDLQSSLQSMEETMANLKLGTAAIGAEVPSKVTGGTSAAAAASVGAPSLPEGEASMSRPGGLDVQMEQAKETDATVSGAHVWATFGSSTKVQTFSLQDVPFKMEPVTREVKRLVDRMDKEEVIDLFAKFCDLPVIPAVGFSRVITAYAALKAQKQHDEVMRQPYVKGRARPGVGSADLRERPMGTPRATHQCPQCFTDWPLQWDTKEAKMCICHHKVIPVKKTAHITTMESKDHRWLLFVTGNGITWVRDGSPVPEAAPARGGDTQKERVEPDLAFKRDNAVDIGGLAEAPLCPADHAETSLSDYITSRDRLQLRTEVLNRVVDAETFPEADESRPQVSKDIKHGQAALVFHPDAAEALKMASKLTSADIPPEAAFHPKRSEEELTEVVTSNADIIHDMQSGAISVEDPQGAELLRRLDMMKFKEVLKRKFLEGPGSNQSSLEALNRSVVNIEQAKLQNKKYEEERRNYKASISPPVGNPTIWGPELQEFIEQGTFCPLTALRKPNVDLDSHAARGEYMKAKLNLVQHKLGAFPPALLTEVPQCQLDMQVARDVPDDRAVPMETDKLVPGSPEAKVAMLYNMLNMSDGQIRVHAGRWTKYESMEEPTWAKEKQPSWEDALAMERRTHPSDQGGHFLEFHTYTEEEIEDHRRLGLRPLWRDLKGHFFAWEPAPASGGAGTCWVKEVQTWTLPTLLGVYGHQFSLKQLWYAWENLPIAVKRHGRGQRGGGAEGARERVLERKKIQQETNDFLEVMNIPKPTTQEEWRAVWKEVGTLLAAKHFITHTPVPVMDLPIATVVDSKEHLRFRAMCDERISFPFEELREFPDVYSKLEPYVAADSFVEVKVAWRCNTEQWWWAEVHPSQAGPLYKKLGYSDAAIRAFGLDPEGPVGTPYLPAAASGADQGSQPPLLMEYPDQPRPPITVENVKSVLGTKAKKGLQAQNKHLFWAKTECGLVLSSVTPWEITNKEKGVTTGGYMCKHCQGFWKQGKGATRLVQIIGRHKGRKISLQLIMDEPPEALYNQWIKDRIEYYKRVEPVAAPRDEQLDLGPPVARIRLSHSNDRGPVGQLIWQSILSNRELANLQYIGKVADKHAQKARSSGDATLRG